MSAKCVLRRFIGPEPPIADYEFVGRAIPGWADLVKIEEIYNKRDYYNKLWGTKFEVDHCVPIKSKEVCGLHVHDNLQLLDSDVNGRKGNRDWPTD